jgi:NAD+ synthase (glutamine-hydrolysing)
MPPFMLGLAQIDTRLGDVRANLDKHLDLVDAARKAGVELLAFPELSLTGYMLQDQVASVAFLPTPEDKTFGPLLKASHDLDLLVGFVDVDSRYRYFIAAAYLSAGKVVHVHRKVYLPTYGLFDEGRFFSPGETMGAFNTRFGRLGVLVCEEFWHASSPYLLWLDGADMLLFMSASPVRGLTSDDQLESVAWVERVNQAYASLFTVHVAHTVRVGFEDGLLFGGRATAFGPSGDLLAAGPDFQEGLTLARIDPDQVRRARIRLPLLRDERPAWVERQLAQIRRDRIQNPPAGSR